MKLTQKTHHMKAYYPSLLRLTLWTPFSTPVEGIHIMDFQINLTCTIRNSGLRLLLYFVDELLGFQNGSAFQSGIFA